MLALTHKKRSHLWSFVLILALAFTLSGCLFRSPVPTPDPIPDQVAVIPTNTPRSTTPPEPTMTVPEAFDFIMKRGNFSEVQKAQLAIAYLLDPEGDWIYSIADQVILTQLIQTDIQGYYGVPVSLNKVSADNWFSDSNLPCNQDIEGGWVVCQQPAQPMPEGEVLILAMQLGDESPPMDPDHYYTYAAVLDADGDPSNNFQFVPPYNWDYFQNTDRWYMMDWNPLTGNWTLDVVQAQPDPNPVPSKARVVVTGDVMTFIIPGEEYSAVLPGFRLTAFGHDGTYAPGASCGDVTGGNPKESLLIPLIKPLLVEGIEE